MTRSRVVGCIGLWLALLLAAPAFAGSVYRCESPDGSRTYASKRLAGAKCIAITSYTPSPTPRHLSSPATTMRAVTDPVREADVRQPPAAGAAVGNAVPANPVAGSPVTAALIASPATAASDRVPAMQPAATVPAKLPPAVPVTRRVQGQVYSYIKDGVRNYTSKPPKGVAGATAIRAIPYSFIETCFACALQPGVDFRTLRLNTAAFDAEIRAAAAQQGVEEAIVRAIIHAESSFNPNALSRVGAQGLMQLMPATARRFGVSNAFDPSQNIRGGVQYLAWLLKRYNGDLALVAAGYNAGEGAVDRYKGVPPYSETRRYVERVRLLAERYRGVRAGSG